MTCVKHILCDVPQSIDVFFPYFRMAYEEFALLLFSRDQRLKCSHYTLAIFVSPVRSRANMKHC